MNFLVRGAIVFLSIGFVCQTGLAQERVYTRATNGEAETIDPHLISSAAEAPIVVELFEGLTTADAKGNTIPGTAESWQVSQDGKTYVFKLREGLAWSDGTPFTVEDHAWSVRRYLDPATPNPLAHQLYVIKNAEAVNRGELPTSELGVKVLNKYSIEFNLEHPAPYFPDLFLARALPVPRHVIEKHGSNWTKKEHYVSNGAFILEDRVPQLHIRLKPNPMFRNVSSIQLDAVEFIPNEDLAGGVNRFRAGVFDMVLNFPQNRFKSLKEEYPDSVKTSPFPGFDYYALNTETPPFDDVRVRRALSMAIDRRTLTERIMITGEQPAYQLVAPGTANYNTPARLDFADAPMAERIVTARALMEDAGYSPSNTLKLTLKYNTREDIQRVASVVALMWRQIHVEANLLNADARVHRGDIMRGDFEVARWLAFGDFDDPLGYLTPFLSDAGPGTNESRYNNPEFDRLVETAKFESNVERRESLLAEAEAMVLNDQPIIPLYYIASKRLIASRVSGWEPNRRDIHLIRYITVDASR